MRYAYYPGCSLTATAQEYDTATRAVCAQLGVELEEIPDWTCCGASAAEPVSRLLTSVLPARNLALAEALPPHEGVLIPCSACYLNHLRVEIETERAAEQKREINAVLAEEDLCYTGGAFVVRHLLELLGIPAIQKALAAQTLHPLHELSIAPYYGCQILRPYARFDAPEHPRSMEPILHAVGANIHTWALGNACCGASLMTTHQPAALHSVARILHAAQGADAIVTVCPMCQLNLEGFQRQALHDFPEDARIPVLYLPQLLGLALGLAPEDLHLRKNLYAGPFARGLPHQIRETADAVPGPGPESPPNPTL